MWCNLVCRRFRRFLRQVWTGPPHRGARLSRPGVHFRLLRGEHLEDRWLLSIGACADTLNRDDPSPDLVYASPTSANLPLSGEGADDTAKQPNAAAVMLADSSVSATPSSAICPEVPTSLPGPGVPEESVEPTRAGWETVFSEGFEGAFPGSAWTLYGNPT